MPGGEGDQADRETLVIFTDRSRYALGLQRCLRARWLRYEAGPLAMGFDPKAIGLPLVTGTYTHEMLADLTRQAITDGYPTRDFVRATNKKIADQYKDLVARRGLLGIDSRTDRVVAEQCALIEGFGWVFYFEILPWLLENYEVYLVEEEQPFVASCSCGLGDGPFTADHEARGCQGLVVMTRPDLLALNKRSTQLTYFEAKTTKQKRWLDPRLHVLQLRTYARALEVRYGRGISEAYILGFIKGARGGAWNPDEGQEEGPDEQQSPLCYGWLKQGSAVEPDEFYYTQYYWDDQPYGVQKNRPPGPKGYRHKVSNKFQKVASWEYSTVEAWVEKMPPDLRREQAWLSPPVPDPGRTGESLLTEMTNFERRHLETKWKLYEALQKAGDWDHPDFHRALDAELPRSWNCYPFGAESFACDFLEICEGKIPLSQVLESGRFILRRPHHDEELKAAEARGVAVPASGEGEEREE